MKLVVTAKDRDGKSVFTHGDEPLRSIPLPGGGGFEELWVTEGTDLLSDADALLGSASFYPEAGDSRFRVVKLMPDYLAGAGVASENEATPYVQLEVVEADAPGMHTTATIDLVVVLSGTVELELDDGAKKTLRAGDCVVQRATRHRWIPQGGEPVVLAVVMLGAEIAKS